MGLKKLFEKFQEGCLEKDKLWYLSGMTEAFLSLFWPNPSNQEDISFGRCCFDNFKMVV